MHRRILLVDGDAEGARLLKDNLELEGFQVVHAGNRDDALASAEQFGPDLVLLDLMLPDGARGLDLCRALAGRGDRIPVIILTAAGETEDRVRGLRGGADDYVVKPFALDELLARIHAVLRRSTSRVESLTLGPVTIDFRHRRAAIGNRELELTDLEFELLQCLAERAGTVVSRNELLRIVWGYSDAPMTRTVDSFVYRLRHKIERNPHRPRYIRTVYGAGYRMALDRSYKSKSHRRRQAATPGGSAAPGASERRSV